MKNTLFISHSFILSLLSFLLLLCISCAPSTPASSTFKGEPKAVLLADQMFEAIGGKGAWCELKSLYIKAEHTEPQMSIPYQSEIWRGIDQFEIVIEQQNDSFHVKGVIGKDGGIIRYYDKRDTSRTLTDQQLKSWEFDHKHNVYVLLHDLGCSPEAYEVRIDENDRLAFYQDSVFMTSFGLDDQKRPYLFYHPNSEGQVLGSTFTQWGTDGGLVHSAGGHPLDSNFIYNTEIWQPSKQSLKESFGEAIFEIQ